MKKYENLFKAYKEDKIINGISRNVHHESKSFDTMDKWWHQAKQAMKHVFATTTSYEENQSNLTPDEVESLITTIPTSLLTSEGKGNFQERFIGFFEKMAKIAPILLNILKETISFFKTLTTNLIVSSRNCSAF